MAYNGFMSGKPGSFDDSEESEEDYRRRERWDFESWRFIGILLAVGFLGLAVILKILGV